MMKNEFIGTWSLLSYELQVEEGDPIYPMGICPIGIMTFDTYGNISVHLSNSDRHGFTSDPPGSGEIHAAFTSYIAYFGKYTLDEEKKTLTTKVIGGINPDWVGEDQLRFYSMSEDRLVLKTAPQQVKALGDINVVGKVIWERVAS